MWITDIFVQTFLSMSNTRTKLYLHNSHDKKIAYDSFFYVFFTSIFLCLNDSFIFQKMRQEKYSKFIHKIPKITTTNLFILYM